MDERLAARLVEVGTTNRTRVADFEEVLAAGRATLVLRVHPSNFRQDGFTESPDARKLAAVAHAHGGIVVEWLVENGDPVSPGQPLLRLHPTVETSEATEVTR